MTFFTEEYVMQNKEVNIKSSLLMLLYYHKMPKISRLFSMTPRCYTVRMSDNDKTFMRGAGGYGR